MDWIEIIKLKAILSLSWLCDFHIVFFFNELPLRNWIVISLSVIALIIDEGCLFIRRIYGIQAHKADVSWQS